ncbi:MAG TPA: GPW/gp25 family protein [Jatrophihabitantaceae bacterium]|nr:GPW/gp25 family protein [Jatrophihabitantaceae bacterium]
MSTADFLGRGWAYPLRLDGSGGFALAEAEDDVDQSIRLILGTALGERPMRPEYGCAIHDLIFDSIDASLSGRVASEVRKSLTRWEPRIQITEVIANPHPVDSHVLLISIGYRIRATNDRRNLVFPFYSIPEE